MLRLAADENFNQHIVNGLRRRLSGVLEVPDLMPTAQAIEELGLTVQLLGSEEIKDRVLRLPL